MERPFAGGLGWSVWVIRFSGLGDSIGRVGDSVGRVGGACGTRSVPTTLGPLARLLSGGLEFVTCIPCWHGGIVSDEPADMKQ